MACSPTQYQNTALEAGAANTERRSIAPPAPDRPAILMAFSGGGTRGAALAESVLRDMHATSYIDRDGSPHVLTDDVRLISSVSGGSVTAAWFGLRGANGLDTLRDNFLTKDNMRTLGFEAVDPITWLRLTFTSYTRIRALEDLFDRELFQHLTMAELNRAGLPIILMNTTDMAGGETFAMSPQRFDDICSAFDAMPISTAVAASAAFPVALSPVDFRNNGGRDCKGSIGSDTWATLDLKDGRSAYLNLAGYRDARYTNDLRRGADPFRDIQYLHFLDGGLADNLGVKTLRSALISANDHARGLYAINTGQIQKLVVILVNARSDPPSAIYQQASTPGLAAAVDTVISTPIDANTANSQQALDELLGELAQIADAAKQMNAGFKELKVYGISIDYDQLPSDTEAHRKLRDAAKDVPTSWTLTPRELDVTEQVGRFLLERDPCYALLVADLGAMPPAHAEDTVNTSCLTAINR